MATNTGSYAHSINIKCDHTLIQVSATPTPGLFTLWALVGSTLHQLKLTVPRVFYVNSRSSRELRGEGTAWRSVSRTLPRSSPCLNLCEYSVPEGVFQDHAG